MRVLCSTTAGDGHFGPLKAVARACVQAGHEVRVAAPASFAGAVRRAGLEHSRCDDAPRELMDPVLAGLPGMGLEEANEIVMREVFGRLDAQHGFPAIRAAVADWEPDIILREPAEFGSLAAAEAAGVPHAEVAIGVAELMVWAHDQLVEPLGELEVLAGLPEGRLVREVRTAPVFTMVPASVDRARTNGLLGDAPVRPVMRYSVVPDASGGRLPPAWGDPALPLVYVTFGTVTAGLGQLAAVFEAALAALAGLPVRVLLTTGHAGGLELPQPWPSNSHVEKYWPQDEVMPLAAAVVGHGGFGTTMSALRAGVPQVLVPLFALDQHLNADLVAAVGAGARLDGGPAAIPELGSAVKRVLADPGIQRSARDVASEIAALPDVTEVVHEIERLGGSPGR